VLQRHRVRLSQPVRYSAFTAATVHEYPVRLPVERAHARYLGLALTHRAATSPASGSSKRGNRELYGSRSFGRRVTPIPGEEKGECDGLTSPCGGDVVLAAACGVAT
jgi:hypothetical protein